MTQSPSISHRGRVRRGEGPKYRATSTHAIRRTHTHTYLRHSTPIHHTPASAPTGCSSVAGMAAAAAAAAIRAAAATAVALPSASRSAMSMGTVPSNSLSDPLIHRRTRGHPKRGARVDATGRCTSAHGRGALLGSLGHGACGHCSSPCQCFARPDA